VSCPIRAVRPPLSNMEADSPLSVEVRPPGADPPGIHAGSILSIGSGRGSGQTAICKKREIALLKLRRVTILQVGLCRPPLYPIGGRSALGNLRALTGV
jgi:hypothetical protein